MRNASMTTSTHSRARRPSGISHLRQRYFSGAGETAMRYAVSFEDVITHLWSARGLRRRFALNSIRYVDDLVHAIACIEGQSLAWADLSEYYEPALSRTCRVQSDRSHSVVFVRQLFADLRHRLEDDSLRHIPCLRSYVGMTPLRTWLNDRLSGFMNRRLRDDAGAGQARQLVEMKGRGAPVLRLVGDGGDPIAGFNTMPLGSPSS